jgi:GH43 family beta-xylosidase
MSVLHASDDRVKSEEIPIENATEVLLKLTPTNYFKHPSYRVDEDDESPIPEKDASGNQIYKEWESGLISQEVLKVNELQHIVECIPDLTDEGETKCIKYTELIPWLIKSNQELHERIKQLESK